MAAKRTLSEEIQEKIKHDLIYGYYDEKGTKQYPTIKEAAEWYKVSYDSLRHAARPWNWKQERADHKNRVHRKVTQKKAEQKEQISELEAEKIVVEDAKFNQAANMLRRAVVNELKAIASGKVVKSLGYQLQNLGKALESAQKVSKTAAGEPSEYTESQVKGGFTGQYNVTKTLICTNEHINHEKRILEEAGKAQGITD